MYPENNQTPIDYLNQIAPAPHTPGLSKRALVMIAVGIGLALIFIIGLVLASTGKSSQSEMETLTARLQAMRDVSDKSQSIIKSTSLRGANSTLTIVLNNAIHDIASPLSANGVNIKNIDKTIVAKEKADAITADLENARLNAVFDDTYAREMAFKLTTIALLMDQISHQTNSTSMKNFIIKTNDNLQPIKKQFEAFNATTR